MYKRQGLTLSWLKENLLSRGAKSVKICTMLRKPEALKVEVDVAYVCLLYTSRCV